MIVIGKKGNKKCSNRISTGRYYRTKRYHSPNSKHNNKQTYDCQKDTPVSQGCHGCHRNDPFAALKFEKDWIHVTNRTAKSSQINAVIYYVERCIAGCTNIFQYIFG